MLYRTGSVMDGTIRIRTAAWFATAIVLAVVCTLLVTQAWSAGAAPGDEDSTFVPTAGCRVADTRAAFAVGPRTTPLAADETFTVAIHGENGECVGPLAIPADAVAVALNVTATNATTNSNIRVFPADLTEVPNLSNLNVSAGAPPTPNKVDVKLSPDGKIKVYNFRGSVNIFIDIVGYYTNATLQELAARVAALEAADVVADTKIAALESAQPVAMSARNDSVALGTPGGGDVPTVIAKVSMTPTVAGQITANSVTNVATGDFISGAPTPFAPTTCSITTGTVIDAAYTQVFTPDNTSSFASPSGLLSGTRTVDVAAGVPVSVNLICQHVSALYTRTDLTDSVLTAIFTPAP